MSEIVVREITPFGKTAAYGGVDLGVKENMSRGTAYATSIRKISDKRQMNVTILPDTAHNRVTLTQQADVPRRRGNMWIFVRKAGEPMQPLSKDWELEMFGDLAPYRAEDDDPEEEKLPAGASRDPHDTADRDDDGSPASTLKYALGAGDPGNPPDRPTAQNKKAAKAPTKGKAAPAGKATPAPAGPRIASLEDFLGLPMPKQMEALKEAPLEFLQEVATSDSNSLEEDVKTAAFQRVTELTGG